MSQLAMNPIACGDSFVYRACALTPISIVPHRRRCNRRGGTVPIFAGTAAKPWSTKRGLSPLTLAPKPLAVSQDTGIPLSSFSLNLRGTRVILASPLLAPLQPACVYNTASDVWFLPLAAITDDEVTQTRSFSRPPRRRAGSGSTCIPRTPCLQDLVLISSTAFWDAYLKNNPAAKKFLAEGEFEKRLGQEGTWEKKSKE